MKKNSSLKKSIFLGLAVLLGLIIYAYGFQVTKVNFEKTRSERRLTQLTRIIRALAHPNIIEYEQDELEVETPVYLPCPEGEITPPEPDTSGPYLVLNPACASPGEFIVVEGHKFTPETKGPINFIPPSGASLTIGGFTADSEGNFEQRVKLPNRQPLEEAQIIRAISRRNVGAPYFSTIAHATWEKIRETVFLALLATTIGTMLAIPISFLAARNLMSDVKSPLTSVAFTVLGWPLGIAIGILAVGWVGQLRDMLTTNLALNLGGLVVSPLIAWGAARWALPQGESRQPDAAIRLARILALIVAAVSVILSTYLLTNLMFTVGEKLTDGLGPFGFLGYFIAQLGEVFRMVTPAAAAATSGAVVGSALSKLGLLFTERLPASGLRVINLLLAAIAGATLFAILGTGIEWLYQFDNPVKTLWWPAATGAVLGGLLSLRAGAKDVIPIGTVLYYLVRTILNAVRSVEPLVMVIVFVVWVGIGPFAGALALALHTIAALSKLYSEQVESIQPGPLEAVTATGATRLQTIMYAVIPQIVPPYISFTMYRWDINVRMSTIIGFAGGGGIGFLLQQNINLLNYRGASVQMLAIAVVVASMDYISSVLRERLV